MELGCFLAGVIISAQGHGLGEEIENLIQPLKDFLSAIFFSSIGTHGRLSLCHSLWAICVFTTNVLLYIVFRFACLSSISYI